MITTITDNPPFSRDMLLKGLNEALSVLDGYQPETDLEVIQELLSYHPKIVDRLYASAGSTDNPKWISAVWKICNQDDLHIFRTIAPLKDSEKVLDKLAKQMPKQDLEKALDDLVVTSARIRFDYITIARLSASGLLSTDTICQNLRKLSRPASFTQKLHHIGVLDDSRAFEVMKNNANHNQVIETLKFLTPHAALCQWATPKLRARSPKGNRVDTFEELLKLGRQTPEYLEWISNLVVAERRSDVAWIMFRIGQGEFDSVQDPELKARFKLHMPIDKLKHLVLDTNDVFIAGQMAEAGLVEHEFRADIIEAAGLLAEAVVDNDDLSEDREELYKAIFSHHAKEIEKTELVFKHRYTSSNSAKINQPDVSDLPLKKTLESPHQLGPD